MSLLTGKTIYAKLQPGTYTAQLLQIHEVPATETKQEYIEFHIQLHDDKRTIIDRRFINSLPHLLRQVRYQLFQETPATDTQIIEQMHKQQFNLYVSHNEDYVNYNYSPPRITTEDTTDF